MEPTRTKEKRQAPKNTWRRGVEQEMKEAHIACGSTETTAQDCAQWTQLVGGRCSTAGATK